VSNELGAGRPEAARLATRVVVLLALAVGVSEGLVMVLVRNLWGYAYSNEEEVARYTARMMPILAVSIVFDGLQSVLSCELVHSPTSEAHFDLTHIIL
jgi:MATE family multidrug resistance protein